MDNKTKKYKILKSILIIVSVFFTIPSIVFLVKNKSILGFDGNLEYCFLLTNKVNRLYQAFVYAFLLSAFLICYFLILKYRKKIFTNIKQIYLFIIIISLIFILVVPFWCSDVFYYLGTGRLAQKYGQNPYYTDIQTYVDSSGINIQNDTVIQKGYNNYWGNTTVVYGPVWTIICSIVSLFSLGSIDLGLFVFKLITLLVHIGNCFLLYKISNKKIFTLAYGINPFILIEGIANVHNDMFVIFFVLLALYFLLKKKNIILSILFLAFATNIKYFTILFLPIVIIYYYRDKNIKTRILKCFEYGIIFLIFIILPYLPYIKDAKVFIGMFTQQNKIAKGVYLFMSEYFNNPQNLVRNC